MGSLFDYQTENEQVYHCGASSKDGGNMVTTITAITDGEIYGATDIWTGLACREKLMRGHRMMGGVVATTFLETARPVAKITGYIHPQYHHSKYRKTFILNMCRK